MHNLFGGIFVIALLIPVGLGLFASGVTADKVCGSSGSSHQSIFYNGGSPTSSLADNFDYVNNLYSPDHDSAFVGMINQGAWNGKDVTKIQLWVGAYNQGNHTLTFPIRAGVYDSQGNLVGDFGTVSASTLVPGDANDFSNLTPALFTWTGNHVMAINESIGFTYTENGTGQSGLTNPWHLGIMGFADYNTATPNAAIMDYYGILNNNDPTFKDNGNPAVSMRAIFYETSGGNGHNPHCVEALNVALLTPLIAVGGIIVLLIKRYNDN